MKCTFRFEYKLTKKNLDVRMEMLDRPWSNLTFIWLNCISFKYTRANRQETNITITMSLNMAKLERHVKQMPMYMHNKYNTHILKRSWRSPLLEMHNWDENRELWNTRHWCWCNGKCLISANKSFVNWDRLDFLFFCYLLNVEISTFFFLPLCTQPLFIWI